MPQNPEIRSGEIDEILGKTPGRIIRSGIAVFFVVIIVFLAGSWFFKYPDTIAGSVEITSDKPPAEIKARTSGKIDTIFVVNNQKVSKGQLLGIIENPAGFDEVNRLKRILQKNVHVASDTFHPDISIENAGNKLGELQQFYTALQTSQHALSTFTRIGYHAEQIAILEKQLSDHQLLFNYSYDQRNTLEKDYELAQKDFLRYKKLFDEQVIPEQELEKIQSYYLAKKLAFENSRTTLASLKIQINQLKGNIRDLELQYQQQLENHINTIGEARQNLLAQIEIWEQRYVLWSPQSGSCIFTRFWSSNQNINTGETVFTILPRDSGAIRGLMQIPAAGAGKIAVGQRVNIRLDNYPYMEYGLLEGIVSGISDVPEQGSYFVTIAFPEGLVTSYGQALALNLQMTGIAEIITHDIRLFQRIMQPLRHILTSKT